MAIRLISAKRVGDDLAAGRIAAGDQSLYLTASFLIWMIPAYLFLFPAPRTIDPDFFWGIWLVELALLVLFCIVGIGFCLRNCRIDPQRNFLVDFSCLNAPISFTTLAVVCGRVPPPRRAVVFVARVRARLRRRSPAGLRRRSIHCLP
jgi:hypothetical protein